MKEVTKRMIKDFRIMDTRIDFMGYHVDRETSLSFHHLIIPKRNCQKERIPSEGYVYWNGAILVQETSHDYLHLIERHDYDRFCAITSEMIDENMKKRIDIENLRAINDILESFEVEYLNTPGKDIIKKQYLRRRKQ